MVVPSQAVEAAQAGAQGSSAAARAAHTSREKVRLKRIVGSSCVLCFLRPAPGRFPSGKRTKGRPFVRRGVSAGKRGVLPVYVAIATQNRWIPVALATRMSSGSTHHTDLSFSGWAAAGRAAGALFASYVFTPSLLQIKNAASLQSRKDTTIRRPYQPLLSNRRHRRFRQYPGALRPRRAAVCAP